MPLFPKFLRKRRSREGAVDWRETPEAHVITADLPGFKKEEVKVEVEARCVLQISAQRKIDEGMSRNDTWHNRERRLNLTRNSNLDEVKADMDNGVFTVTVPKITIIKPNIKSVQISG